MFFAFISAGSIDNSFFEAVDKFNNLVDYEAYETNLGKEVLDICEKAKKENENQSDDTLRIYRNAVLDGFIGTILLKRNSYISGIARTGDSQKNWEKITSSRFADEANFVLALTEYYKITLFNKSPKNDKKLNAVINKMRAVVAKEDEVLLKLSLSYIWVLRDQNLWDEAEKLSARFFGKFPDNTLMLRAMQAIASDNKNTGEIRFYAEKLAKISLNRNPINYSDYLSAKRAEIFALNLENKKEKACEIANKTIEFSKTIPTEDRKISWVKKHLEAIEKESKKCK